jgi:ABC-2 type transport system permease protein
VLLADLFRIFICECKVRLTRAVEFRVNFFIGIFTSFTFSCAAPLFQFLIYRSTTGYPGWSFDQILLFQALLLFWSGFTKTLFGNIRPLIEVCFKYGLFDRYLVYPYPPIGLLLTNGFDYQSVGTLLAGVITVIYSIIKLKLHIDITVILLFFFFQVQGILLYLAFIIFYCAIALKLINIKRLDEILNNIFFFGNFPAEVFSGILQFIYLSVLPLAIWIYYPAQVLLDRIEIFPITAVILCPVLFSGSLFFWYIQLKRYTSAGG